MATFAEPLRTSFGPFDERQRRRLGFGAPLAHGLLLATAFAVFAWPIALATGVVACAGCTVLGAIGAEGLVARRFRLPFIAAIAAGIFGLGAGLIALVESSGLFAAALSPSGTMHLSEALRFGTVALSLSLILRGTALRFRSALAVEGTVVVLAVATTVAAHRDGMIARPLEVSDWFWTQGVDPVVAFLAVGLFGALLLAGVLAYGRSPGRTIAQLLVVFLVGVFLLAAMHGRDSAMDRRDAVGDALSKKSDARTESQGGGSGQSNQRPPDDGLPPPGGAGKDRPSAVVIFHKDVTPESGFFYFRHGAFSQFNGVRLVEATRPDVDVDARHTFPRGPREIPGPQREGVGRTMVATDVALLSHHSRMFMLTDGVEAAPMPNPEPARFRRAYRVVSNVFTGGLETVLNLKAGDSEWSDDVWEHYTELPNDPRYRELAASLRDGLRPEWQEDPIALALAVKMYLEKSATYSFKRKYEGEEDPTAAFLFSEDMRGYCVHLAHAAAYLLRALGVPTRVSAGYAVPASNLGGGSALLVKAGDAHAWAEVYLARVGWVPVEVAPEKTDIQPRQFGERDLQQLLGEMARKEGRRERAIYQGPRLADVLKKVLGYLPWLLAVLVTLAYVLKLWRLLAPSLSGPSKQTRLAYRAALDRLSAAGLIRQTGEPRERFARRLHDATPSFEPLTQAHVAVALGSHVGAGDGRNLRSLSRRVGRELRGAVPWWRWLLGLLNPLSWLFSK